MHTCVTIEPEPEEPSQPVTHEDKSESERSTKAKLKRPIIYHGPSLKKLGRYVDLPLEDDACRAHRTGGETDIFSRTNATQPEPEKKLIDWKHYADLFGLNHFLLARIFMDQCALLLACTAGMTAVAFYVEYRVSVNAFGATYLVYSSKLKLYQSICFGLTMISIYIATKTNHWSYYLPPYAIFSVINFILILIAISSYLDILDPVMSKDYMSPYPDKFYYSKPDSEVERFVKFQRQFTCCGSENYTDYHHQSIYPSTCCQKDNLNGSCRYEPDMEPLVMNFKGCSKAFHEYNRTILEPGATFLYFEILVITFVTGVLVVFLWRLDRLSTLQRRQVFAYRAKTRRYVREPKASKSELRNPDLLMEYYAKFIQERNTEMGPGGAFPGKFTRARLGKIILMMQLLIRDRALFRIPRRRKYMTLLIRVLNSVETLDDFLMQLEVIAGYYEMFPERKLPMWFFANFRPRERKLRFMINNEILTIGGSDASIGGHSKVYRATGRKKRVPQFEEEEEDDESDIATACVLPKVHAFTNLTK